jgi:hypothetical protein
MPTLDSLSVLQRSLITLEFAVNDALLEVANLKHLPNEELELLQNHAHMVNIATHNLILTARAALARDPNEPYLSLA